LFLHRASAVRLPATTRSSDDAEDILHRRDFGDLPASLFIPGREAVWLELVDLDARSTVDGGPWRLLLGASLRAEHPDLHERALGVLQSLTGSGFPARLALTIPAVLVAPGGTFKFGLDSFVTATINGISDAAAFDLVRRVGLFRIEDLRRQREGVREPSGQLTSLHLGQADGSLDGYQAYAALKRQLST